MPLVVLLEGASRHGCQRLQIPPPVVVLRGALGEEADRVDGRHAAAVAEPGLKELQAEAGVVREAVREDIPAGFVFIRGRAREGWVSVRKEGEGKRVGLGLEPENAPAV